MLRAGSAGSFSLRSVASRHSSTTAINSWQPVIGIEVHAQIKSRNKLFSDSFTDINARASVSEEDRVSLFDAAFPGTLPRLNKTCLDLAIRTSLALQADVQRRSTFDRKHYFYPDLPSGYQITQKYSPIARGGRLRLGGAEGKVVRIQQIQLEQDTAKSTSHPHSDYTQVDLSRAGVALMEIVSEPDMRQAVASQRKLREQGLAVPQETRGFDEDAAETYRLRSKEDTPDYRYMPDPNLPPVIVGKEYIDHIRSAMPTLPEETRERLISTYQLSPRDTDVLMNIDVGADIGFDGEPPSRLGAVAYFESVVRGRRDPKVVANWMMHELIGQLSYKGQTFKENPLSAERLGEVIDAVEENLVTGTSGKLLLRHLLETRSDAPLVQLIDLLGLRASSSASELVDLCHAAIEMLPKESELVAQGNDRVLMKVVGRVMKLSKGTANAQAVREELLRQLRK
ncbi:aspartyl-tRNA(Asn)/glutamyl-tRNA (Gln) amidotransferase subunit B [Ceratobasidium sp. AG-Ba]|nr:aspartyl-tRNA(Asn)/glutamyl-tRNA (Gln) amidotransferase subunit B [Ceratobasidium sp. AG-Ba]QRW01378.1 aspartyl-tRNA(Asn)/glutamyl-tRNA (Gln) amidotransferase subunit B [Ceratobasidium sp. AG-Ba]